MPGLVANAVSVFFRVGKMEAKFRRVLFQPAMFDRSRKTLREFQMIRRPNVERTSGVMFAATRRCDRLENFTDGNPSYEFLSDNFCLPRNAAESGDWNQRDVIVRRSSLHSGPCARCAGRKPNDATLRIPTDAHESRGLVLSRHVPGDRIVRRNSELSPELAER